jgi:hypothetical protein
VLEKSLRRSVGSLARFASIRFEVSLERCTQIFLTEPTLESVQAELIEKNYGAMTNLKVGPQAPSSIVDLDRMTVREILETHLSPLETEEGRWAKRINVPHEPAQ